MYDINLPDGRAALDLGLLLGQRRALAAVGGRCSAAQAQILRRVRDEKLYRPLAPSWRAFCLQFLPISRRHADYLIGLLNRFGPVYFEIAQLTGISPAQYLVIQPAVREDSLVIDGQSLSLVPENAPKILNAIDRILASAPHRPAAPETVRTRASSLAGRMRHLSTQLVDLYRSCRKWEDREYIVELATELRLILMQPGTE
jgi:hypothetical protein